MAKPEREPGKIVRMPTGVAAFGPFRFENRTGRLYRDDAEIHLTPREFDVLRVLIDRRGRTVSKDELFAAVWKGTTVTDDALLQVVSTVRKALGDDPRRPDYIQTVSGQGYRFIGEVEDWPSDAPDERVAGAITPRRRTLNLGNVAIAMVLIIAMLGVWALASGGFETPPAGADEALLAEAGTDDLRAYDAYLQGKYFLARYTASAFAAAERNFQRAIDLDPDFARAWVGLADAYLMQERYGVVPLDDAVAAAEPAIERALAIDDELGVAHAMLGLILQRQGDTDAAEAAYEQALRLDPDTARTYQLYWWMMFLKEGNTGRTMALAAKAFEADPLSPAQNENYGWMLFEEGRFEEARAYFEKSIELEPAYPFGFMGLGGYHFAMHQMDEAIEAYEQAVSLSPETSNFRRTLADAYMAVGRADEAIEQLEASIAIQPSDGGRYADIGEVYWDVLGEPAEAVGWFEEAIHRDPDAPRPRMMLALALLDLGDDEGAERWIESAEQIDPDDRWSLVGRVNLYMYRGQYAEGVGPARRAASMAPFRGYLSQFDRPYSDFEPLGYFSLLAGRPSDALLFPTRTYPELLDDDPVISRFNVNAAIDLAVTFLHTGEDGRAERLLLNAQQFIESQSEDLRRTRYREEPAQIYALRGMATEALAALREAIDNGWRRGSWRMMHKPHYVSLRARTEFEALVGWAGSSAGR